jgi:hypothetical protein
MIVPIWYTEAALREAHDAVVTFMAALARGDELKVARLLDPCVAAARGMRISLCLSILELDRPTARTIAVELDRRIVFRRVTVSPEAVRFGMVAGRGRVRQLRAQRTDGDWRVVPLRPESRWARMQRAVKRVPTVTPTR